MYFLKWVATKLCTNAVVRPYVRAPGAAQLLVGAPAPSPLSADLPEAWVRRLTNIHPTSAGFEVAVSPPEPLQAGLGAPGEDDTSPND